MRLILTLLLAVWFTGCSSQPRSGPESCSETSAMRPKLADRVAFIEHYVKFQRVYLKLEYSVYYQNNGGGMVPGPSDWDIRILAMVPADEIDDWIPPGAEATNADPPSWLADVPGSIPTSGITEWYEQGFSVAVGIDRSTATIAYRNSTLGMD